MKTKYTLIFLMTLTSSLLFSQWTQVFDNQGVNSACFAKSKDTCIVAGMNGRIYRTTDAGASWDSIQTVFKTSWFLDIEFPSGSIGYACGGSAFGAHKSTIVKTTDGGVIWDSLASDIYGYNLHTACFLNDNVGFFGGDGHLLKTINGGQTFSLQLIPAVIYDFFFTSANTGFFAGANKISRTMDQGQTWSTVFTDTTSVNSIFFTSNNIGFAVGDKGALLRTTDGGNTWIKTLITGDTVFLRDIQFLDNNTGYIAASRYQVGDGGYIYKTTDGGNTWVRQMTTNVSLSGISMVSNNEGYAAGYRKVFKIGQNGTSVPELNSARPAFEIYPNPSQGFLTLNVNDAMKRGQVLVYNASGQQVRNIPIAESAVNIAVNDLPTGVYLVSLSDSSGKVIGQQKIIVSR